MPKKTGAEVASASASATSLSADLRYEDAVAELEALIATMESGKLSLEDTLTAYKRGAELLKHCQHVLEQVEQQVKMVQG
jgi:exodeoxyribonuclease VII small subunit